LAEAIRSGVRRISVIVIALLLAAIASPCGAGRRPLTIAATTSISDSGLVDALLPSFKTRTGISGRLLSRSSALALISAERGNVDVVIVNDPAAVDRFVESGHGVKRRRVMLDDFVIAGPAGDPAALRGSTDAAAALRSIARQRLPFLSRGDESGTNVAEQKLWQAAGVNPKARSGNWYMESGLGMGATLEMAVRSSSYVFTDRATWLALKDRGTLEVLIENDPRLINIYEVILINPARHPDTNAAEGEAFIDWLVSMEGQDLIRTFTIGGRQVFIPAAEPSR
jgi:tungstate transport system substrate-binding protein